MLFRSLSRLHAVRNLTEGEARSLAETLLSPRSPGTWNEAMMELGATICTPKKPVCARCPVSAQCLGRERAEHWSEGKPRRRSVALFVEMALVERRGRVLLTRNPAGGLLGGLYELPHSGLPGQRAGATALREQYRGVLKIGARVEARFRHAVTHHRIDATVLRAEAVPGAGLRGARFHSADAAAALPLGGLTRKALRAAGLLKGQ